MKAKVCPECGTHNLIEKRHCIECGYPLAEVAPTEENNDETHNASQLKEKIRKVLFKDRDNLEENKEMGKRRVATIAILIIIVIVCAIYIIKELFTSVYSANTAMTLYIDDSNAESISNNGDDAEGNSEQDSLGIVKEVPALMNLTGGYYSRDAKGRSDEDIENAISELEKRGIEIEWDWECTATMDVYKILAQSVSPGTKLDSFSTLKITRSAGTFMNGWYLDDAIKELSDAGWNAKVEHEYDGRTRSGTIIKHEISSTEHLETLIVNDGCEAVNLVPSDCTISADVDEIILAKNESRVLEISCSGEELPDHFIFNNIFWVDADVEYLGWKEDTVNELQIKGHKGAKSQKGYLRVYLENEDTGERLAYTDIYIVME